MRKVLIAGLARFKGIERWNCFLAGRNAFLFNTKQNSFFKKKQVVVPEILKEEDSKPQAQLLKPLEPQKKEQLQDLLSNYEHYFTKQLHNLPLFLQRLSKSLDQKISVKDISKLQDIYNKIHKCSSDLSLKPIQYLQILIFIEKYTQIAAKYHSTKPMMANNGFEHRATMTCATFLLNNSLTMTQAVMFFKIFTSIGSISNLFLANFTKFLKFQFQNEILKTKIKLEHILAILSNYFLKNNRTILENVLYDMTLNHLLSNPHLISESSSPSLHVQLFTYLLRIDLRYFYMSQQRDLANCLKMLAQKVLLYYKNTKTKNLNTFYSVYLLESCDYYLSAKNNNIEIQALAQKIINEIHKKYKSAQIKLNEEKLFSRLFFNRRLFKINMERAQIVKKIAKEMTHQESLYPLIDRFYDSDQNQAAQLLTEIFESKKHVSLPATSKIMLNVFSTHEQITTFWKEIIESNKKVWMQNQLFLYSLLIYSSQKNPKLVEDSQIKQFDEKLRENVHYLSQNKHGFILSLFETINMYRDVNSCSFWISQILNLVKFQQYLLISNTKQAEHESHQVRYIAIAALALSYQPSLTIPAKFSDYNMYSYLRTLYPLSHPNHQYSKPIHFLQSDEYFKRNMEVVVRLAGGFEKYSYLLWDIFINNYIQKSQNVRAACFDLLKSLFSKAFDKQAARRIVLLSNLTNYMSSQVIIASQSQLQKLFESFLRPLVDQKIHEKFHYHCFLQLTFNALSLGILTKQSFTKIINRCLAADKCIPSSYKTSSVLLLYGMTMKNSDNVYSQFYFQQRKYIKYLLDNKLVKLVNGSLSKEEQQKLQGTNRKYVMAGSKFLCILLQYGQNQLLNISEEILTFVRSNLYLSEVLQLHNSFHPEQYDLKDKNLLKFARLLNFALQQKIDSFYMMKQIRKDTHNQVIAKLAQNHKLINRFIQ